ncbi:membrane dipeptidase, partial [Streptomyces sp. E11-3]
MADLQDAAHAPGEVGQLDTPDPAADRPPGLDQARELLAAHPVADGCSGLAAALRRLSFYDLKLGESGLHTDLPRLRAGRVGAMFWSLRVPDDRGARAGGPP